MIGFKQYLKEENMDYATLTSLLISLGYKDLKKISSNKIAVLTNDNRIKTLEAIQKGVIGAKYDTTPGSDSSAGRVKVGAFSILAKPASKQGKASAGVENEDMLVQYINTSTKSGPMNVFFVGDNKTFEVFGCVGAKSVGADTAGRKKADVVLEDYKGVMYPISIKKDDAETWESADSYFSQEAKKIIDKAIKAGHTKLVNQGTFYTIEPNIAVHATPSEKRDVVFGSDIENKGCVVTKTFRTNSFETKEDIIYIDCTNVITEMSDVKGAKDVLFLIRNDKTRKSIKEYPGIRILAAYAKRINKNVKVVDR